MIDDRESIAVVAHRARTLDVRIGLARIDFENLTTEYADTGAHALWYGVLAAQALGDHERAKDHLKIVEAEVGVDLRASHTGFGEKFTVDSIRDEVLVHARTREARAATIVAEENMEILRAVRDNVARKDQKLAALGASVGREILANTPVRGDVFRDSMRARRSEIESAPSKKKKPQRQRVDD